MHHHLLASGCLGLLACAASAQVFTETFSFPDGNLVPGWTTYAGSFGIRNGRLINATGATVWSYITKDGITATNCVLDGEFFYVGSGVQFGGLTARHQGAGNTTLMCKIQDNGATADFDRVFFYNQPGGSIYADIPGGTLSAYCRMIVVGSSGWMQVDANKDGIYEQTIGPQALTVLTSGGVGMNVYSTSEMDNFEFFDAVLKEQPNSQPKIGTSYQLELYSDDKMTPYVGLAALGNAGIPIGTRRIPLSADPLLSLSLTLGGALGLVGLTDGSGNGKPSFAIPNDPALMGLGVYVSAFTLDPAKPFGIGSISNEHHFAIQL